MNDNDYKQIAVSQLLDLIENSKFSTFSIDCECEAYVCDDGNYNSVIEVNEEGERHVLVDDETLRNCCVHLVNDGGKLLVKLFDPEGDFSTDFTMWERVSFEDIMKDLNPVEETNEWFGYNNND